MRPKDFERFFNGISQNFTVGMFAEPRPEDLEVGKKIDKDMPLFDAADLFENNDYLSIGDKLIIRQKKLLKRPIRILLFIQLTELESKLYRILEWSNYPLEKLNGMMLNDYIKELINNEKLLGLQGIYSSRKSFKEDLKAISSIRNLIVHVNKKLELEYCVHNVIKRKRQLAKLIEAAAQILDKLEERRK